MFILGRFCLSIGFYVDQVDKTLKTIFGIHYFLDVGEIPFVDRI